MVHFENDNAQLVSVIIPVFNNERYIAEAIESVLSQSYPFFELIIIDDGSVDGSRDIIISYPGVRYFYQTNRGVASARNRGIKESRGQFIAFLDADDLWLPEKLSLQMKAFNLDPALEIVSGYVEQFVSPELTPQEAKKYLFLKKPLAGYSPGAIMLRRDLLEKIGLFHEDYQGQEAISWFANAIDKGVQLFILPEVVARRRIHGNNISILNNENKNSTIIRILKGSIDRKRAMDNSVKGS